MSVSTNGMSDRLARMRGVSVPALAMESAAAAALKVDPPQRGAGGAGGTIPVPASIPVRVWACLSSFDVHEFVDVIVQSSCPGFRLHSGEIWLAVTPQLLGWMSSQIDSGLRQAIVSDDLGQAIDLFHRARDASGLEPVAVTAGWTPPGLGRMAPVDWDDGDAALRVGPSQMGLGGTGGTGQSVAWRRSASPTPFPVGSVVFTRFPIQTVSGDVAGALEVMAVGESSANQWVTLGRRGKFLASCVNVTCVEVR